MNRRVLIVDDDENLLATCRTTLRKQFTLETALGADEALDTIEHDEPYAVIVSDMRMPGMDGLQLLQAVQTRSPDSVRMMLTGNADLDTAIRAVNDGNVFRFITKPCPTADLVKVLESGIRQYRLVMAERELLEQTLHGAIKVCTEILSSVDQRTYGRAMQIREHITPIAHAVGVDPVWQIEVAALLAEIGNATIPPVVLVRQRHGNTLSGAETDMLSRVPVRGHDLIASIPRLESVARTVLYARKGYDGSGIPNDDVAGEDIPKPARLLRIVSDFVGLEADGESKRRAIEILRSRSGSYDPGLLEAAAPFLCPAPGGDVATTTSLSIAFSDLRVGDLLRSNVETADGVLITQAGTILTSTLLERMRNFVELNSAKEPIVVERKVATPAAAGAR